MEASELFDICRELATTPPGAEATSRLHQVLVLTCAEGCRQQGGAFGNLFAQVDFLCKRIGLSTQLTFDVQTARRHTKSVQPIGEADWPYDVMAVVRLVSAVFQADVPGTLLQLLPADTRPRRKRLRINKDYLRCIVDRVEPDFIHAHTDDGPLVVDYRNTDDGRDLAYLAKVLRPGMQMNLLDSHVAEADDGPTVVVPTIVVVEPDFLIDISSLAACFTNYGHHTLLYTLNRLKDSPNTQAILIGNFAGTALDDIIRLQREDKNYEALSDDEVTARSLRRYFREQALRLLACGDFDATQFKQLAVEQVRNIRQAVAIIGSTTKSFLLEPSFVSEQLGVQGRVDLMSDIRPEAPQHYAAGTPRTLLVEQKSGRNFKIERDSHDSHGMQVETHYVQLLLYFGVLRYNFGLSDRQVDMRLLYSRYPAAKGLLTVNYYRTLLREALRLRNQIVATELLIAREGFGRITPLLTADYIYKGIARDTFFQRYVEPGVNRLSSQLRSLTPLERTYYERMLTFVYREQLASKIGSAEMRLHHSGGSTADLWQMSLAEKMEAGNIIIGSIKDRPTPKTIPQVPTGPTPSPSLKGGEQIVLLQIKQMASLYTPLPTREGMGEGPGLLLNFRRGDMVFLYAFEGEPDARHSVLFKATLQEIGTDTVTLVMADAQQNADLFDPSQRRLWAVEPSSKDVGTVSHIRSLHQFITSAPDRRYLLLGQRPPRANTGLRLSRSYHPDYDEVLLRIKQARDYFLLVGPPGTGKTSMALRFMVEEEGSGNILLTAYTNRAVDEICNMLCDTGKAFLRLGKEASCDARFRPYLLDVALADSQRLSDAQRIVDDTPIIVSTTSMLLAQPWVLQLKRFALAIVDEASQILEPGLVGLLSHDAVERFVLVGDHKQLPAVVQQAPEQSMVTEQCLRDIGLDDCRQSLFERLLRWERQQGRTSFIGTLHAHGRMHPQVAQFPISHFYQHEELHAVPLPHQCEADLGYDQPARDHLDELLKTRRVLFLPSRPSPQPLPKGRGEVSLAAPFPSENLYTPRPLGRGKGEGLGAEAESYLVADLLTRIHRFTASHFNPAKTVGVIVPYRRQIAQIRQALTAMASPLAPMATDICIDTVERYQGSQRDVIIFSFGVTHRFQLDFLTASTFADDDGTLVDRKLNVALTRARRQMIIVGQPDVLSHVTLFRQLIDSYRE
ncbi:MAG: AAA family ATPase [Prevotella sp.]|nr:AAA family ATPase [Prevotella sp.]